MSTRSIPSSTWTLLSEDSLASSPCIILVPTAAIYGETALPGTPPSFTLGFSVTCGVGVVMPVLQLRLLKVCNLPEIIQWVSWEAITGTQIFWVRGLCFFLSANVRDDWLFMWSCSVSVSPLAFLTNSFFWVVCYVSTNWASCIHYLVFVPTATMMQRCR